ncbi:hypothetical protein KFZ58_18210 [Virgibacillus sp. NKC19-16]|nr:hypothetical protein [Virgibacillus sp. NKC19-16]UJL46262.1 hypothetical protein KFZ58_18210 [Virgibacillus sp. NKC19-16]
MKNKKKKNKTTIASNEAVHGKPHLDIDRAINMSPLDYPDHYRKDKKLGQ